MQDYKDFKCLLKILIINHLINKLGNLTDSHLILS